MKNLIKAINDEWSRLYGGSPVDGEAQLITRVRKIAEDRDCMLANWRAIEAAYQKADKKLRSRES